MNKPTLFLSFTTDKILPKDLNKLEDKFVVRCWRGKGALSQEEAKIFVEGVSAILCGDNINIDAEVLNAAGKNLKVISSVCIGVDNLDVKLMKEKGIRIGFAGHVNIAAELPAEYAIGLLLSVSRRIVENHISVITNVDYWNSRLTNFHECTSLIDSVVGIIGCGRIGTGIARRLQMFQLKKLFYTSRNHKPEVDALGGELRSVDDVCKESDFIIITIALNEQTRLLINSTRLNSMKSNAVIINVARGEIIDQKALVEILRARKIAGAGLDVTNPEPLEVNNPLRLMKNVVITPHVASHIAEARYTIANVAVENILAAMEGREMPSELS